MTKSSFFLKLFGILTITRAFNVDFSTNFVHFIGKFYFCRMFYKQIVEKVNAGIEKNNFNEISSITVKTPTSKSAAETTTRQPTTTSRPPTSTTGPLTTSTSLSATTGLSSPSTNADPTLWNFNVKVKTSPVTWSGTDASVFLYLEYGNDTSKYTLKNSPEKDILEHNQVDIFSIQARTISISGPSEFRPYWSFCPNYNFNCPKKTDESLKKLRSCSLEMKPPKCHFFHGWHVEYVQIEFPSETFFCHFWKWLHCHELITSLAYRIK